MCPMAPAVCSANQPLWSEPVVIPERSGLDPPTGISATMAPAVVITPTFPWPLVCSVNQRLPSGPDVMPNGIAPAPCVENSVITPAGVTRPILPPTTFSVNHMLPSLPSVMAQELTLAVGTGEEVTAAAGGPCSPLGS